MYMEALQPALQPALHTPCTYGQNTQKTPPAFGQYHTLRPVHMGQYNPVRKHMFTAALTDHD